MKKTIAILLVLVMALSVVACSKSKDTKKEKTIVGTWEMDLDATYADRDQEMLDFAKEMGISMTLTFNADGTGTTKMTGEEDATFEYKIENNQIVIDGDGADYTLDGDTLKIGLDGETMVFKRK